MNNLWCVLLVFLLIGCGSEECAMEDRIFTQTPLKHQMGHDHIYYRADRQMAGMPLTLRKCSVCEWTQQRITFKEGDTRWTNMGNKVVMSCGETIDE